MATRKENIRVCVCVCVRIHLRRLHPKLLWHWARLIPQLAFFDSRVIVGPKTLGRLPRGSPRSRDEAQCALARHSLPWFGVIEETLLPYFYELSVALCDTIRHTQMNPTNGFLTGISARYAGTGASRFKRISWYQCVYFFETRSVTGGFMARLRVLPACAAFEYGGCTSAVNVCSEGWCMRAGPSLRRKDGWIRSEGNKWEKGC